MIIIKTTTNTKGNAKQIIDALLGKKLAACIQIQEIESHYTWNGGMQHDKELLLSIKTKKELYKETEVEILKHHSYKVPQIISLKIDNMYKEYKNWMNRALNK